MQRFKIYKKTALSSKMLNLYFIMVLWISDRSLWSTTRVNNSSKARWASRISWFGLK